MNTSRELPLDNPREEKPQLNSVEYFITESLGYCCEWFFLSLYEDAELIGLRLGVTTDTIRRHKKWKREGKIQCRQCSNCNKKLVKTGELIPK